MQLGRQADLAIGAAAAGARDWRRPELGASGRRSEHQGGGGQSIEASVARGRSGLGKRGRQISVRST
jgi:hypothetical protein